MSVDRSTSSATYEMSEYIDLQTYDLYEIYHEHYLEMRDFMVLSLEANLDAGVNRILEIGAGTGLLTEVLMNKNNLHVDALDIDARCCEFLQDKFTGDHKLHIIQGDATSYASKEKYDAIVSTFAYDHIPYYLGKKFVSNVFNLLSNHGICIFGVEVIPFFHNESTRRQALMRYHSYIIDCAVRKGLHELAGLEQEALVSGLNRIGDFKRSHVMMLAELGSTEFVDLSYKKIGPKNMSEDWGVYVYVCKK